MAEYNSPKGKYFRIHKNDAGTEAFRDEYVHWLEREVNKLNTECGHLQADLDEAKAEIAKLQGRS